MTNLDMISSTKVTLMSFYYSKKMVNIYKSKNCGQERTIDQQRSPNLKMECNHD